ncbi:TPA: LysR family transcriptional regulator [Serratia fonticola]
MKLPPLNTLRFFDAVARHQSLIKASEELCVTQSAVSRQIKQLEDTLGISLFERRNRAIFLTPDGVRLKTACQEMLEILKAAIEQLGSCQSDQPLVVSCEPTIMMRWLIPRLPLFNKKKPDIQIHLFAAGGPIDFARNHVDLALRRDDFNWDRNLFSEMIGRELMGPVSKAELLGEAFPLGKISALHTHTRPDAWQHWLKFNNLNIEVINNTWFEHFYIMLEAIGAGVGIGLCSLYMVEKGLRNGQLIAPCGFVPDGSSYHLLSSKPFHIDYRKTAFLTWIREEFNDSEGLYLSQNN